jgi:hypothetical protein
LKKKGFNFNEFKLNAMNDDFKLNNEIKKKMSSYRKSSILTEELFNRKKSIVQKSQNKNDFKKATPDISKRIKIIQLSIQCKIDVDYLDSFNHFDENDYPGKIIFKKENPKNICFQLLQNSLSKENLDIWNSCKNFIFINTEFDLLTLFVC